MMEASGDDDRSLERARAAGAGADARSAEAGSDLEGVRGEDGIGRGAALRAPKTLGAQGCLRSPAAS